MKVLYGTRSLFYKFYFARILSIYQFAQYVASLHTKVLSQSRSSIFLNRVSLHTTMELQYRHFMTDCVMMQTDRLVLVAG